MGATSRPARRHRDGHQPANPANSGGPNPTEQAVVHLTVHLGRRSANATRKRGHTTDVGYQVHVTFTDVDGDHARNIRASPSRARSRLERRSRRSWGSQGFTLSLDDAPGGSGKMIAIDVNVGRCNDATLCDRPTSTWARVDIDQRRCQGLGGLVSAGSGGRSPKYRRSAASSSA